MNFPYDVVVCLMTYNQAPTIEQAVRSVMDQQLPYSLHLLIGDDASTDEAPAILNQLKDKYGERITLYAHQTNLGHRGKNNFVDLYHKAQKLGRYIALLEGDDYWHSPHKLAKQIDYLEAHPDCNLSFHAVRYINENRPGWEELSNQHGAEPRTAEDLCQWNLIHTPSVVYRNWRCDPLPEWYFACEMGDWPLHLINTGDGPIHFIKEPLATYRRHDGGSWEGLPQAEQLIRTLNAMAWMNKGTAYRYNAAFQKGMAHFASCLLNETANPEQWEKPYHLIPQALRPFCHVYAAGPSPWHVLRTKLKGTLKQVQASLRK